MKVTLDLTKPLDQGTITVAEQDRLARLGRADTGTLLVNVLLGFGVVAALLGGARIVLLSQGVTGFGDTGQPVMPPWAAYLLLVTLFAVCAVPARSGPLASLAVLVLFAVLGSSSSYGHAFYELQVRQPVATVVAFSALALAAHAASRAVAWDWARLPTVVARTALFLVNLGFLGGLAVAGQPAAGSCRRHGVGGRDRTGRARLGRHALVGLAAA